MRRKEDPLRIKRQLSLSEHLSKGGTIKEYYKENQLRRKAAGRGSLDFIFGGTAIGDLINAFQKKPSKEEQEKALEEVKSRFSEDDDVDVDRRGKEPNKPTKKTSSTKKNEILEAIKGINVSIEGLKKDVLKNMVKMTKLLSTVAGHLKETSNGFSPSDMKPQTIRMGDKEYLHYPHAPEERQFYEKSKITGGAGRLASKEVKKELSKLTPSASKKRAGTSNEDADKQLQEKLRQAFREIEQSLTKNSELMLSKLQTSLKKDDTKTKEKINEVFTHIKTLEKDLASFIKKQASEEMEPDEKEAMTEKALHNALKKIMEENPEMFSGGEGDSGGGFGVLDVLGSVLSRRRSPPSGKGGILSKIGKGVVKAGGAVAKGASTLTRVAGKAFVKGGSAIAGTATKAAGAISKSAIPALKAGGSAAKKGALKGLAKLGGKSLLKKIPIIGALAGLGFAAARLTKGDFTGAAMEAASGIAGTVPGLGTATSVALDVGLAAKDAGMLNLTPDAAEPLSSEDDIGNAIVEMNRQNENLARTASQQEPAPIIVNRNNYSTAMPIMTDNKISVSNSENTFNRLLAQDLDHPSSYSNFNMG